MRPGRPGGGGVAPRFFCACPVCGVSQPSDPPSPPQRPPLPLHLQAWPPPAPTRAQGRPLPFLPLCPQALHSLGLGLLAGLHALRPWRYALKQIGGQFGSSVLSYFLFLKTLLAFNALLLLPLLAFIVGVQAAFPPPAPPGSVPSFTGLELLTGGVRARSGRGSRGGAGGVCRRGPCLLPHLAWLPPGSPRPCLCRDSPGGYSQPLLDTRPALSPGGPGSPGMAVALCLPLCSPLCPCPALLLALPPWVPSLCLVKPEAGSGMGRGRVPDCPGPPPCRAASPTPSCTTATTVTAQ